MKKGMWLTLPSLNLVRTAVVHVELMNRNAEGHNVNQRCDPTVVSILQAQKCYQMRLKVFVLDKLA